MPTECYRPIIAADVLDCCWVDFGSGRGPAVLRAAVDGRKEGRASGWVDLHTVPAIIYLASQFRPCPPACPHCARWQGGSGRPSALCSRRKGNDRLSTPTSSFLPSLFPSSGGAGDDGMVGRSLGPSDTMHAKPSHSLSLSLSPSRPGFRHKGSTFPFSSPPLSSPLPLPLLVQRFALRPQSRFSPWFGPAAAAAVQPTTFVPKIILVISPFCPPVPYA